MYALYFTLLIIGGFSAGKSLGRAYFFLMMLILLAIMGFRSEDVGEDTQRYIETFERMAYIGFDDLLQDMQEAREPLYLLMTWGMRVFTSSYVFYLFGWALFPCVAIYLTIKDELDTPQDYMVAILCLFALGFFAFFVAGIRQTAAISLVFLSYKYLRNIDLGFNPLSYFKWDSVKFLLCIFSAYFLHNSAIIFLIALPFLNIKIRWWYLPFVVALFFVSSVTTVGFIVDLATIFFDDRFAAYGTFYESSRSINGFIMLFLLFLICFFQYPKLREKDKNNIYLFNLILIGLVFLSFAGMVAEMWRVSFYFSIFTLILVPRAIKEYSPQFRSIIYPAFTMFLLIYLFSLSRTQLPEYSSSIF